MRLSLFLFSVFLCAVLPTVAQVPPAHTGLNLVAQVQSPDGKLRLDLYCTNAPDDNLIASLQRDGQELLRLPQLGLDLQGEAPLGVGDHVLSVDATHIDETWQPVTGKTRQAHNLANETTVHLAALGGTDKGRFALVIRAYDDGVAFRYVLPKEGRGGDAVVTGDRTQFEPCGDWPCWYADYRSFASSQEGNFVPGKLSNITEGKSLVGMPLLMRTASRGQDDVPDSRLGVGQRLSVPDGQPKEADAVYLALTEADLTHWAGARLSLDRISRVESGVFPQSYFYPLLGLKLATENGQPPVKTTLPAQSPWRVVMVGQTPGDLIASNLIDNLNPPSQIQDTSWIKPGLASWDWWSGRSRMETAEIEKFIQLSADMGWPYMLLDAGWSYHTDQPDGDITRVVDGLDMPELLRFAKERHVRLWLWMSWRDVLRNDAYKKAFPMFRDWGIAGLKIDYMDRENQGMVDFYHTMFQATAENHLMLDLHGAYKPTGARRAWPNFITQEGVLGNEQNRGSRNDTARHNVTIPYTRMLLGPMDYTPGGFVNQTPAQFQPVEQMHPPGHGTTVPNTRGQELAKFVVFESPFQMACDYPDNYRDQLGADFLKVVKTSWDEVRFLGGEVGEFIILARRAGDEWFVGGMTNEDARKIDVKLDFLPMGKTYRATIWRDAPDADQDATKLLREEKSVANSDTLALPMAPAGGFVLHLIPDR